MEQSIIKYYNYILYENMGCMAKIIWKYNKCLINRFALWWWGDWFKVNFSIWYYYESTSRKLSDEKYVLESMDHRASSWNVKLTYNLKFGYIRIKLKSYNYYNKSPTSHKNNVVPYKNFHIRHPVCIYLRSIWSFHDMKMVIASLKSTQFVFH